MAGSHHNDDDGRHHEDDSNHDHYGIAFGLTIIAGLATVVGALLVLGLMVRHHRKRQQDGPTSKHQSKEILDQPQLYTTYLSGGLALAAGSIVYVAMADLFPEGIEFFVADAATEQAAQHATLWTTLCFFGGALFMALWAAVVHRMLLHTPVVQAKAVEETNDEENATDHDVEVETSVSTKDGSVSATMTRDERATLCHAGISTAIALILHSLPEGLVTFIATAQDPTIGAALAIGIALHNVAEGMSIAWPIYFAKNNYSKALGASAVAGLAPVVGGVIGYALLQSDGAWSDTAFGIMFGLAAGMLIYVAIKELLRTAYKYDPTDKVTTVAFFVGMAMIAVALVILESTGNHHHATGGGHGEHDAWVTKEDSMTADGHSH